MKYVAFLDVLGFKQLLKGCEQYEAEQFVSTRLPKYYDGT